MVTDHNDIYNEMMSQYSSTSSEEDDEFLHQCASVAVDSQAVTQTPIPSSRTKKRQTISTKVTGALNESVFGSLFERYYEFDDDRQVRVSAEDTAKTRKKTETTMRLFRGGPRIAGALDIKQKQKIPRRCHEVLPKRRCIDHDAIFNDKDWHLFDMQVVTCGATLMSQSCMQARGDGFNGRVTGVILEKELGKGSKRTWARNT